MIESSHTIVNSGLQGLGGIFKAVVESTTSVGGSLGEAIQNLVNAVFGAL